MTDENLGKAFAILQEIKGQWQDNTVNSLGNDPFLVLVSCILSHRTKDQVTKEATQRLRAVAPTPEDILKISEEELSQIIYPVDFIAERLKLYGK
jgi:endonuclease-3